MMGLIHRLFHRPQPPEITRSPLGHSVALEVADQARQEMEHLRKERVRDVVETRREQRAIRHKIRLESDRDWLESALTNRLDKEDRP